MKEYIYDKSATKLLEVHISHQLSIKYEIVHRVDCQTDVVQQLCCQNGNPWPKVVTWEQKLKHNSKLKESIE